MKMILCPNCQKLTGYKRVLGFGTFFMVLLTFGLWLLVVPFYPMRCIICGLTRGSAFWENLRTNPRKTIASPNTVVGLLLIFMAFVVIVVGVVTRPNTSRRELAPIAGGSESSSSPHRQLQGGGASTTTEAFTVADKITNVDAIALLAAYQSNEEAAQARYGNKRIVVTGRLSGLFVPPPRQVMNMAEKGLTANAFMTIAGPRPSSVEESLMLPGIMAYSANNSLFGEQDVDAVFQLKIGQVVTLICTCGDGHPALAQVSGSRNSGNYSIQMEDCTLRNPQPTITHATTVPTSLQPQDTSGSSKEAGTDSFTKSPRNPGFRTYVNGRFGFSIDYPESFSAKEPPENGAGITLISPDGEAELVVAGGNNSGFTLKEYYDMSVKDVHGQLGYQKISGGWFVTTWNKGGKLTYLKMFVGSGSQNSFTFTFPESQRADYENIVTKMEKSFHHGDIDRAQ